MMRFGSKYLELKKKSRVMTITKDISKTNVTDALAQFLYSNSLINDDQEVKNIELLPSADNLMKLKITYVKVRKEVRSNR